MTNKKMWAYYQNVIKFQRVFPRFIRGSAEERHRGGAQCCQGQHTVDGTSEHLS